MICPSCKTGSVKGRRVGPYDPACPPSHPHDWHTHNACTLCPHMFVTEEPKP